MMHTFANFERMFLNGIVTDENFLTLGIPKIATEFVLNIIRHSKLE